MKSKIARGGIAALLASVALGVSEPARADPFVASRCDSGDPLCVPFSVSALARRSLADGTLTEEDRASLRAIGAQTLHAAIVSTREIPARNESQLAELRRLARAVDAFAPAGACDAIVATGTSVGLCTGTTKGPLGNVRVRMPVVVTLTERANGSLRVVITNPRAMEVKPLLSWTPVVDPEHAKLVIDFVPRENGWLVYSRIAVDMRDHVSSADTIAAALEKLDRWLTKHLGG